MANVKGEAAKSGLRLYQSAVPVNEFVPDLVVMLMMPPPVFPYCAENADVCTVNSCTVSGEKLTIVRPRLTPVLLAPSAVIIPLIGLPPPTVKLHPGQVVTPTNAGFSEPASPPILGRVRARSSTLRFTSGMS